MSQKPKRGTIEREEYKERIKYLLKSKRGEKGLSKVKLCKEILDIPISTYNTYEYYGSLPRDPEMVKKIANALDIPISELLPDAAEPEKEHRLARQLSDRVFDELNPLFNSAEKLNEQYNEFYGNDGDSPEAAYRPWLTETVYFFMAELISAGIKRSEKILKDICQHEPWGKDISWEDKQEDTET